MYTFRNRWEAHQNELTSLWQSLYHKQDLTELFTLLMNTHNLRPQELKDHNSQRMKNPLWYLEAHMHGYMLYVDKCNRTFKGLKDTLHYFSSFKVRYLHLMPCMSMPLTNNDGGHAVENFTYIAECESYVFTTFHPYQWDLNYSNYLVLLSMLDSLLTVANYGVEVFRFDAVPYIWKQWGTRNRNLPKVYTLLRVFRLALEIVCLSTLIKGEVVMRPQEVAPYVDSEDKPLCHLLYNVPLMVQVWNSLATRDTRLLQNCITHTPKTIPSSACWVTYLRCHDDIGWSIEEEELRSLGFDPFLHRQFLLSFYQGQYPHSFALGELYEYNPKTQDARTCGTSASLSGVEKALRDKDTYQLELAAKRLSLAQVFLYLCKGITELYSGDERAMLNDYSYHMNPVLAKDSRNVHRPLFPWKSDSPLAFALSETLKNVITYCSNSSDFRSDSQETVLGSSDIAVFALTPGTEHVVLLNMSEHEKSVQFSSSLFASYREVFSQRELSLNEEPFILGPYQYLLLKRM